MLQQAAPRRGWFPSLDGSIVDSVRKRDGGVATADWLLSEVALAEAEVSQAFLGDDVGCRMAQRVGEVAMVVLGSHRSHCRSIS